MNLIEIGEIVNTHGIRGEIKLNPWTDSLDALTDIRLFYYKKDGQVLTLHARQVRIHKNCAIIQAEEIHDMKTAEAFKGCTLYVEKSDSLPEGRYYIADLIGLRVLADDRELGRITDVFPTGANDVYEVRAEGCRPIYVPAISQVVQEINIQEGYMRVAVPDGLLDEA